MIQYIKDFFMSLVAGMLLIIPICCIFILMLLSVVHAFVCFNKDYSDIVKDWYEAVVDIAKECM
jgi:hypothetical protein